MLQGNVFRGLDVLARFYHLFWSYSSSDFFDHHPISKIIIYSVSGWIIPRTYGQHMRVIYMAVELLIY